MNRLLSRFPALLVLVAASALVAGCDLIGDVLEFGFWAFVIVVVLVVVLIWWLIRKLGSGRRGPPPTV